MKRQKNNKGFSLTELIVVIAVMGVVMIGGVITLGLLYSASAKEASSKLNSALNKTRTECMTKSSASILIEEKADSRYYITYNISGNDQPAVLIGDSRVVISYKDSENDSTTIAGSNTLTISFDRETGAFKQINAEGTPVYCKEIHIEAGHKTYTIQCERLTGKTTLK